MKQKFDITGMTCSACSSRIEKSIAQLTGVNTVSVNLLTNSMQVDFDNKLLSIDNIIQNVNKVGYSASVVSSDLNKKTATSSPEKSGVEEEIKNYHTRLWVSFGFLIPLMYISMGSMWGAPLPAFLSGISNGVAFGLTQFLLCLPIIGVNMQYFTKGFRALWHKNPNMDSLIAVGASAALLYGIFAIYRMSYGLAIGDMSIVHQYHMDLYFESAAMILALITLGKFLETRSKGKTSEALNRLINLSPKTALIEKNGVIAEVAIEQVAVGDIVVIKPGSSVPVDGVVIEGQTNIDEAAITGESIPVFKEVGSGVIGATINKSGFIKIKATKVGQDTTFAQIIALVENASSTKAPIAKIADKIAGIFVPVVMAIALITAIVWLLLGATFEFALSTAICVLVISCPCALGLATPVAIMVGTGKGAENGILIKSGEALEITHKVETVVLDKTGTITQGKPKVTDILPFTISTDTLLKIAIAAETKSEHPLAQAICEYGKENNITPFAVAHFDSIAGKGITASIDGTTYLAGNAKLMQENHIDLSTVSRQADDLATQGKTPLFFADTTKIIGIIAVADIIKPSSKQAIQDLRDMGLEVIMLTGDNQMTAQGIGKDLPLSQIIAEVLPQDKEKVVSQLQEQGKIVAMVGDGVNDAPALVRSDVGIAIGNGTDVAIESADIILMRSDLSSVATAIKLSKSVIRNIKENLFWAFFYNCLGIPLAAGLFYPAFGWKLSPMFGAAAMSFSSLFVVGNALRLKLFQAKNLSLPQENIQAQQKEIVKMITLKIKGMSCGHCKKHVEDALNALPQVHAEVDLEKQEARVSAPEEMPAQQLADAVTAAGYEVVGILQ